MYTTHVRHLLHLHRQKVTLAFVTILLLTGFTLPQLKAQEKSRKSLFAVHLSDYDDRPLHYGFFLAGHSTRLQREYSRLFIDGGDTVHAVNPKGAPGYGIGFIVSLAFDPQLDIALLPSFAYYERTVEYRFASGRSQSQTIESGFLEFPVLLRYKSVRRGNIRAYMVGGIKPGVEIGSNKKDKGAQDLRTNNVDMSVDYGFGFDLFYEYFKLSPELRFSHGITNMLVQDPNVYSTSLNRLSSHTVSFYLYF
jgi:hypothetical protein